MRATTHEVDLHLELRERRAAADGVALLTLRNAAGGRLPAWSPGAHIDLHLAPGLVRQYSLCGDPADPSRWEVAVLREQHSRGGSEIAHALTPGATLRARGPRNLFPLEPAEEYLFVAGGIGIAPLLPMVAEVASRGGVPWRLVYGGRTRDAMAFADTLVEEYGDQVELFPEDEHGLLPLAEVLTRAGGTTATYCCGPESLISATEKVHAEQGRGTLHVERFAPKKPDEPAPTGTFEVEAARSGKVVTVAPDQSVLEALQAAGVHVLSSCTEGLCGSCELFVLAGRPDHRDSILTDAEREESATMFVCVSRSRSPRLVLDA